MFDLLKNAVEKISGCRIYRRSLPRGTDFYMDVARFWKADDFRTVFDVGANVGQSALTYLREFPRAEIHSFEPVVSNFQALQKVAAVHPRLHPYPLAMGKEPGHAEIAVDNTASSMVRRPEVFATETIQVDSLDHFARESKIDTIDFLKIDTEGYELQVLEGARDLLTRQRVRIIYVEAQPMQAHAYLTPFGKLAEFMGPFHYELLGVYEQQSCFDGRRSVLYFNPVFICPDIARQDGPLA